MLQAPGEQAAVGCEPFSIIEVKPEWVIEREALGSKQKFWYEEPENKTRWLFKYPRKGTGEHWAEKVAAEVAAVLGTPHARVELACYQDISGSTTLSFASYGRELIHGNQLLAGKVLGYDPDIKFRNSDHTLTNIWRALEVSFVSARRAHLAKCRFAEFLVLDALIGNTDRHHENWGIVRRRTTTSGWRDALAPSFDHASSLGRELRDHNGSGSTRKYLLDTNGLTKYVNKARGGIFWIAGDPHGLSPLELVRRASMDFPHLFEPALKKIYRLSPTTVDGILARIPANWMSFEARKFASELMLHTSHELRTMIR